MASTPEPWSDPPTSEPLAERLVAGAHHHPGHAARGARPSPGRRLEEDLRRQAAVAAAFNRILLGAHHAPTAVDVARLFLAEAEGLTRSAFGWIGELDAQGRLDTLAMSDPGWAACRMEGAGQASHRGMGARGLFGRLLETGQPLLANQPAAHPASAGLPAGHPALTSFLAVPLTREGRTVGLVALANAPGGYADHDLATLQSLSVALVEAIERKRTELDRSRLALAIEQAGEVIVVTDLAGAIQYVNPAFEAVTGYASAEVLGQNPRLLKSGAQGGDFYRELWATITAGKTWRGTLVNRRKDGRQYTEEASISPVRDASGEVTAYVAVKRDISRSLALEAQLLQARKLEGIGRLAGGVAHDFNNVLAVILSCAGFALRELPPEAPLREELSEIEAAARRAADLTRQLLAFSRRQVLQPVPLDLNAVITEMERMLRRIIGEDVALVLDLAGDLGPVVADPGQLEQVVMNLVVNARDAMPLGGRVTLATRNVHLDAEGCAGRDGLHPGPHVAVRVEDTGVGMDDETSARVFEPFFTTKGLGQGTGLGLATVYGIVRQSGGAISVQSAPGAGTTFELLLPRGPAAPDRAPAPPSAAPAPGGAETILLVEDDPAVRSMAQRILAEAGYRVLAAANGLEALRRCAQEPQGVDLLLTDVVMPEMGGKALAERLARERPGTKVLFMSGYTGGALDHGGVLEPGARLVGKPFGIEELRRAVRAALDAPTPSAPGPS